jgi:hypothetical protein
MKAIKYREKWAHGCGPWRWTMVPDSFTAADVRELMEADGQQYQWSDKFRGMEWVTTRKIPSKVLEAKLQAAKSALKSAKALVKEIKLMGAK